jgi:hypothetical protein
MCHHNLNFVETYINKIEVMVTSINSYNIPNNLIFSIDL